MAPRPSPHRLTSAKVTRWKGARPRGRARWACACAVCACARALCGRACARTCADVLCACARPRRAWDCGCAGRRRPGAGSGCSLLFSFRPAAPSRVGAAWGEGCGGPGSGVFSSRHAFLGCLGRCGELATPPSLSPPPPPPLTFAVPEILIEKVLSPPPQRIGPEVCFVPPTRELSFVIRPR